MRVRIRRALVSVWDKTGLVDFARGLHDLGVEIVSSGNTSTALESEGIPVTRVEEVTGSPEMLMELAYRLVADDSPMYQQIRDNVIVAINPVVEPDGRDRVVDWYHRHKVDETDERTASPGPPYWGKYVFHDNNRDINYSQITMKNVLDWYLQWHPPIMHDLHESVPFMYTFSGQAPQNPTLDPIQIGRAHV